MISRFLNSYISMNLSIIQMNQVIGARELEPIKLPLNSEPVYYWHVYRRSSNGRRWIKIRDFYETEADMAKLYAKFYGTTSFSLRCILRY